VNGFAALRYNLSGLSGLAARAAARHVIDAGMILIAAAIALLTAPAPAAEAAAPKPDMTAYLAGKGLAAIPEDIRQIAKTECQAEADGPSLALVLACARSGDRRTVALDRTASAR
jgi:hypothetical protein